MTSALSLKTSNFIETKDYQGKLIYREWENGSQFRRWYDRHRAIWCYAHRRVWTIWGFREGDFNPLTLIFLIIISGGKIWE